MRTIRNDKLYIPNIDDFIRSVSDTMPFLDSEVMYLTEIESQIKIFAMLTIIGILFIFFALLL